MRHLENPTIARTLVALACLALIGGLAASWQLDRAIVDAGRSDLSSSWDLSAIPFVMAAAAAALVGGALALRRPGLAAGWLFLMLAVSLGLSGVADSYGAYGAVARPGSLPGARFAAVYGDAAFLPWVSLLALILLVTPTGSAPSPRWRLVGWAAAGSCFVFLVAVAFRSTEVDSSPARGITSPLANDSYSPFANALALGMVIVAHLALLAAIGSLVWRLRSGSPEVRQQLRWLMVPAIPFPFLVAGAWVAAGRGDDSLLALLGGGYVAIIPIAVGLAIDRQRLYEMDRIVSRTVAYTILSTVVVATYVTIVMAAGIAGGRASSRSVPVVVAATLAGVVLAGLTRRRLQDAVDRRFNRRAFAAHERVRRYVRQPSSGMSVEAVLRDATGDPSLTVAYWNESRSGWVSESGDSAEPPAGALVLAAVDGSPGATIGFDPGIVSRGLVASLIAEARPELENARLRAAISLQLLEVRESRSRIVAAQLAERKRIERDLHDGSQQRLLALAMNLRATQLSGDAGAALESLPTAIDEIQATVRELRDLANGLHPGVLEDGGLSAAFQELAAHAPIPVCLNVLEKRLSPAVESSAWFIACEAVANVVKHAAAKNIALSAIEEGGLLVLSIEDDGVGGADPEGHGLRGIADRAEAAGGRVSVLRAPGGGTAVRAVLPCGS